MRQSSKAALLSNLSLSTLSLSLTLPAKPTFFSTLSPMISSLNDTDGVRILSTGAGFALLNSCGVLQVTGSDRLEFLHGQLSNDVKGLVLGDVNTSLMLNHKGHALAQMQVVRRQDDVLLMVEGGQLEEVRAQLERHIIFDQVELTPLPDWRVFTLQGPRADEALRALEFLPESGFVEANGVLLYPNARTRAGGYDLLFEDSTNHLDFQDADTVSEAALAAARIAAGIALAHSEAGEGVLPQEAGLEPHVSYKKGCYLGQEIMARIEARGSLRRSLTGLKLDAAPDSKNITLEGKKVGRLGAHVQHPEHGFIALTVLRNDLEGAALQIGNATAEVVTLPLD